jgi:hypothetical protein
VKGQVLAAVPGLHLAAFEATQLTCCKQLPLCTKLKQQHKAKSIHTAVTLGAERLKQVILQIIISAGL